MLRKNPINRYFFSNRKKNTLQYKMMARRFPYEERPFAPFASRNEAMVAKKIAHERALKCWRALTESQPIFGLSHLNVNMGNELATARMQPTQNDLIHRISLLRYEDYNRGEGPKLKNLQGRIRQVAMSSRGYRYLSFLLKKATKKEISMVYKEIIVDAQRLAIHEYGNFVIQRIFKMLDLTQNYYLLESIGVSKIINHPHGNYVIQSAVEILPLPLKIQLACYLKGGVVEAVRNRFGSCAVLKIIDSSSQMDLNLLDFFTREIQGRVIHLSLDKYSGKVIHKMIDTFPVNLIKPIIEVLLASTHALVSSSSGCWILEVMMQRSWYVREQVIGAILLSTPNMAISGAGSHTVITALQWAEPATRQTLIVLLSQPKVVRKLNRTKYGEQVLNFMWKVATFDQQKMIKANLN